MQNAVLASVFPFLAALSPFRATGFRFRQGKSMGTLDSRQSGAKHIHVLVDDPLKMRRNVMFEKTKENILGRGGYVSSVSFR